MNVRISPSWEDAVFKARGLAAEPSALIAGRTAAGQRGAGRREGSDQQAAQGGCRDTWKVREEMIRGDTDPGNAALQSKPEGNQLFLSGQSKN